MAGVLADAAARAGRYLDGLDARSVAPTSVGLSNLGKFTQPLQDHPIDPSQVIRELDDIGSQATVATAGGRFFGFVIGGSLPAALGANILAAAWDQNAVLEASSPIAAELEKVSRGWLVSLLGLPSETEVGFVSGATMANFTGLAAARHALLERQGWDVEAKGLFAAPPITVVLGDEVHVSLLKALSLLGLGRERVVSVPVDGQGRMVAGSCRRSKADDRLPAGRERQHRRFRSDREYLLQGRRPGRLGPRRRRFRPVGRGVAVETPLARRY
jgi:glutamate/tyrosine decarboxylase-like PLP-dependent enzyme